MLREPLVDKVRSNLRGCVEAEDVIDRRGQIQSAFVSMPLDALNPLRIDHARTVDAQSFFSQIANLNCIRAGSVAKIGLRLDTGKRPDRCDHASMELEVI